MRHYYPAAVIRVTATVQTGNVFDKPDQTEEIVFFVRPRMVEVSRNSYREADTCHVEFSAAKFPILPRNVRQILIQVFAGDAGGIGPDYDVLADDANIRFIGYVDEPEMSLSDTDGVHSWKARDYTGLFLDVKRPLSSTVPYYDQDLDAALRQILNSVPGGENIGLRLEIDGAESTAWPNLDEAAPSGLEAAKIPTNQNDTAWDLIKRACDPLALIPRFVLDTLVVSNAKGLTTPTKRPVFVWGLNLVDYHESRRLERVKEGVALMAYSLADRGYIVGLFPPSGDASIQKKIPKTATKKLGAKAAARKEASRAVIGVTATKLDAKDKRSWFSYGNVANQAALTAAAERVYNERSRQEFKGSFTCKRMGVVQTNDKDQVQDAEFDVQGLANGDRIMIDVLPEDKAILGGLEDTDARIRYLIDHGYEDSVAGALVRSFEDGASAPLEVYCHKATHRWDGDSGYSVKCEFQNLISGATKA